MTSVPALNVGLVLGGGGARGLAHIGVLKAFEERNVKPVAISGCSIGAIVGAFYGAGVSPKAMVDMLEQLSYSQLLTFGTIGGLIGGKNIEVYLSSHLPVSTFEELKVPLEITTVDVQEGCLVVVRKGKLVPALQASSALPGIISPVKLMGRYLIDGGVLNNLPVDVIRTMTLEKIIAVDVAAPPNRKLEFDPEQRSLITRLSHFVEGKNPFGEFLKRGLTIELFMKAFDIPQKVLTDMRLSLQPPDMLIRPPLGADIGIEDFDRYEEIIALGYQTACQELDSWL